MTGYAKKFNENATMSFRANNKQFLKNSNKIWEKVEKLIKINFESKPVYGDDDDDKYIKTKIKTYADNIIANFQNKKIQKEKVPCRFLSIIMLDSVIKANKKYYPETFQKNANMYNKREKLRTILMRIQKKVNQIVVLIMKQNLTLIMMNMTNKFKKIF